MAKSSKISAEVMPMSVRLEIELVDQRTDLCRLQLRSLSGLRLSFDVCDVQENPSLKRAGDYEASLWS